MEKRKVVDGLVSIIMPSWNTERFIAETIQSVIDQTYQNWELLIVDDCSTDNTDEVVASFKDDRIKYFHNEKNSGAALTRNRAMREARGEWIAFLDVDDILSLDDKYENIDLLLEDKRYNKYDCIKVFKKGDEPIFKNFVRTSNIHSIKFDADGSIADIATCGTNGKKVYKYISKQKTVYDNICIL